MMGKKELSADKIANNEIISRLKSEEVVDQSGIKLVPFDGSEVSMYEQWFSDPDVIKYLTNKKPPQEFVDDAVQNPNKAYFRIEHPDYGFIGHVGMKKINLVQMSFCRSMVIGRKDLWNQGIGGKVGRMLNDHVKYLGFRRVRALSYVANTASIKNLTNQMGEGTIHDNDDGFDPYMSFKKML